MSKYLVINKNKLIRGYIFRKNIKKFITYLVSNHSGLVIKPNSEGSSVGVSIFKKIESNSLSFHKQNKLIGNATIKIVKKSKKVIWEEFIEGRELTVSILNNKIIVSLIT